MRVCAARLRRTFVRRESCAGGVPRAWRSATRDGGLTRGLAGRGPIVARAAGGAHGVPGTGTLRRVAPGLTGAAASPPRGPTCRCSDRRSLDPTVFAGPRSDSVPPRLSPSPDAIAIASVHTPRCCTARLRMVRSSASASAQRARTDQLRSPPAAASGLWPRGRSVPVRRARRPIATAARPGPSPALGFFPSQVFGHPDGRPDVLGCPRISPGQTFNRPLTRIGRDRWHVAPLVGLGCGRTRVRLASRAGRYRRRETDGVLAAATHMP